MGKSKIVEVYCHECNKKVYKTASAVNAANKKKRPLYCSYSCSNKARTKSLVKTCEYCGTKFSPNRNIKYRRFCSIKCGSLFACDKRYFAFINRWKNGAESGCTSLYGHKTSAYIRRYLFEKNNNCCCMCGWSKINPTTGAVPLEIDHIDGNWRNNLESNLRLVCPNCHSLSPTFRSLNKGKGRRKM